MKAEASRPLNFRELAKGLSIARDERSSFKGIIKTLCDEGEIIKTRGGHYGLPAKMNLIKGTLTCHPNGFGFVIPEEDGAEDIFIPPRKMKDAMHGDGVVARVESCKADGKREGSIIRITQRALKDLVGTFRKTRGSSFVVPSDEKILQDIVIPARSSLKARDGDVVAVEITSYPARHQPATGIITKVLGDPTDPDVEADIITIKYGLSTTFPDEVLLEAEKIPTTVSEAECKGRTDLRDIKSFTIDGETARDFDDAVGIKRTEKGFKLYVSIADVSHYVKVGTALDTEAFARATSVYFPDRCIPMLPETLSNEMCSLKPKVDRLALTAELDFDKSGKEIGAKFYESVINSAERLTYTKVKAILQDKDPELTKQYSAITEDLAVMYELAKLLSKRRSREGSLDFDLPEPQIILDMEGRVEDIIRSERNLAHRLIEDFMLAANRAVARLFTSKKIPAIYRVHDKPDAEKLNDFKEFIKGFSLEITGEPTPKALQKVLQKAAGTSQERLISHVLLRSMKQAVYSEENNGHFGLAFKDYTHFTSPIRRYPDLIVHRLLKEILNKSYTKARQEHMAAWLPSAALHASQRERKAMEAEREIVDLKKAQFMQDKVGDTFPGFISGVTSFGIFVELKEFFVEGLVHITTLGDDYYNFMEKEHCLVGEHTGRRFQLGAEVDVTLVNVDISRRRLELEILEDFAPKSSRPNKKRKTKHDPITSKPSKKPRASKSQADKDEAPKGKKGKRPFYSKFSSPKAKRSKAPRKRSRGKNSDKKS
jgi:ribonuclease R